MTQIAAIFDMDGVLVDTVRINWRVINQVLGDAYGVRVKDEDLHKYIGRAIQDQLQQIQATYNIQLDVPWFLKQTDSLRAEMLKNLRPKEGAHKLLTALEQAQVPIAVGTSMPRATTLDRLSSISLLPYFQAIVTQEDTPKHKPDPAVYLKAAEMLGLPPSSCVVFEDAPSGIQAAKAAKMKCIAIRTGIVSDEDLSEADTIVSSLGEVTIEDIRKLLRQSFVL